MVDYTVRSLLRSIAYETKSANPQESLDFHHWVIKQLCGCLLHPSIPTDAANLRVADIGAGTGYCYSRLDLITVLIIMKHMGFGIEQGTPTDGGNRGLRAFIRSIPAHGPCPTERPLPYTRCPCAIPIGENWHL